MASLLCGGLHRLGVRFWLNPASSVTVYLDNGAQNDRVCKTINSIIDCHQLLLAFHPPSSLNLLRPIELPLDMTNDVCQEDFSLMISSLENRIP